MGQSCSCVQVVEAAHSPHNPHAPNGTASTSAAVLNTAPNESRRNCHPSQAYHYDSQVYDLVRRTGNNTANNNNNNNNNTGGQYHLLYKNSHHHHHHHHKSTGNSSTIASPELTLFEQYQKSQQPPCRMVLKKVKADHTHIYAIRTYDSEQARPGNAPQEISSSTSPSTTITTPASSALKPSKSIESSNNRSIMAAQPSTSEPDLSIDPYTPAQMAHKPETPVHDWVCVSDDLNIFVCDTGLSSEQCDLLVSTTEQVCKGHYAAYTYAKQTLGCREFPSLAHVCHDAVHRVTHAIWSSFPASTRYQLDDREPHIVKYDLSKKERQKLDMHTDKSEWTFLIALSDGCGLDYDGGGTYFEALDATIHVQRGHALVFPGKLRHCGQRITKGLRFLLVGFLVDKQQQQQQQQQHQPQQQHHQQQTSNSNTTVYYPDNVQSSSSSSLSQSNNGNNSGGRRLKNRSGD